jgi:hypothetical protein
VADEAVRATLAEDEVVFVGSAAVMAAMKDAGILAETAKTYVELPVMRVILGEPGETRVLAPPPQAVAGDTAPAQANGVDAAPAKAAGEPAAQAQPEADLLG